MIKTKFRPKKKHMYDPVMGLGQNKKNTPSVTALQ